MDIGNELSLRYGDDLLTADAHRAHVFAYKTLMLNVSLWIYLKWNSAKKSERKIYNFSIKLHGNRLVGS